MTLKVIDITIVNKVIGYCKNKKTNKNKHSFQSFYFIDRHLRLHIDHS